MEHGYELTVTWTGNTGEGTAGYRGYSRAHTIGAAGLPDIHGSADRTFHGDAARWNPEQLLLAALSQCHMLSYLHVCVTEDVVVEEYVDHARGSMRSDPYGSGRFTEAVLRPQIVVSDTSMLERAVRAHQRANELCFIANSVNFPVRHEPAVTAAGGQ